MNTSRINLSMFVMLMLLLVSCRSQQMSNIDRGADVVYREGYPEIRVLASGLFDEDDMPGIDLYIDVVKGSLIYRSENNLFTANMDITIQVYQIVNNDKTLIQNRTDVVTVSDANPRVSESGEMAKLSQRIPLLPGSYEIIVSVVDRSSGKQSIGRTSTTIPDPESDIIGVTDILLLGKNNNNDDGFVPITTYFVQSRYDTLKFQLQVTRLDNEEETLVDMKLSTFVADTSHARELAAIQTSPGSIAYKGIEYSNDKELFTSSRILRSETGSILIEYITPIPRNGNYRFEANISHGSDSKILYKAREFNITTANFPSVRNIREFAQPLAYLMGRREFNELSRITSPDSLKTAIDVFWLSDMRNSNKARQVIELYYTRVEQANKQFSNFKEGWKTDMGMIFILFGPPYYVENNLDSSIWYYSYNRYDPRTTFRFVRPRIANQYFPYQHYILQRDSFYHSVEYEKVQMWRSGHILNTQ
jgi:GWxTD domain-containing protein